MFEKLTTDEVALLEIGKMIKSHRVKHDYMQTDLAREAGVSLPTVSRLENGKSVQLINLIRILRTLDLLERLNDLFPPDGPTPIEQLTGKKRQRVRTYQPDHEPDIVWGEDE